MIKYIVFLTKDQLRYQVTAFLAIRLERFLEKARSVLDYFEPYLGRIEIMGGAGRIERVYFEIKQQHIDQWEKPQIKVKPFVTDMT